MLTVTEHTIGPVGLPCITEAVQQTSKRSRELHRTRYPCMWLALMDNMQQCENVRPWIDTVMHDKTNVGRDAILALAQSLSASMECNSPPLGHPPLTDRDEGEFGTKKDAAAAQYSRAINLLHSNLTNDECKHDLNNLAAIVVFYYYEVSSAGFPFADTADLKPDDFSNAHRWLVVSCGRNGSPGRAKRT